MTCSNTEDYLLKLKGSIAVVGNGDMPECGKLIDSYDNVIRFNGFKLAGYEHIVGTKFTLWCTYGERDKSVPWVDSVPAVSPFTYESPESEQRDSFTKLVYARTPGDVIKLVKQPTTGGMLVSLCSYLKLNVTIFGFDGFKSGHYYHDYDRNSPSNRGAQVYHTECSKELSKLLELPGVRSGLSLN